MTGQAEHLEATAKTAGEERGRVLVVDDEPANRMLLTQGVSALGYVVREAADGRSALEHLSGGEDFDLILLDLMMPGLDGLGVLAALPKPLKVQVVMITAFEDRETRHAALRAGAVDFLTKPLDSVEVSAKVRTLVEISRLRKRELSFATARADAADNLLRLRFEQSRVAQIGWDLERRVTAWNPAAEQLFGWPRSEVIGQCATFMVPQSARPHVDDVWSKLLSGAPADSTNQNVTRDGRTITCEWYNSPLRNSNGQIVGITSQVLDVTERMRLQSALAQAQKLECLGKLAGGVAHDFNNILAAILSFGGFAQEGLAHGDPRRDDIGEVLQAAGRATELTRQLLAFSQQQPAAVEPTDLSERLTSLHKLLVRTLSDNIALVLSLSASPLVVEIDPVAFDQIVLNLAVNARDAMPFGGQLCITLEAAHTPSGSGNPPMARLSVSDSGTGMDEATQLHIFEPFFTTKPKGTGLGLATCFGIVSQAGGRISVKSSPGQGATFVVELPLSTATAQTAARPSPNVVAGNGETLLLAEDDEVVRRITARVLTRAGYDVVVACDGPEAIRKLDELGHRIAVVLSDVVMPGCSGVAVAEYARHVVPDAAIVLTSGYPDVTDREALEGYEVLWKPQPPEALVTAIGVALGTRPARLSETKAASLGVLIVEDEPALAKAISRVLTVTGHRPQVVHTEADAVARLQAEPLPDVVFADLSLADGSGVGVFRWIEEHAPSLVGRAFIVTGGPVEPAARQLVESGRFKVLAKPIEPPRLLEALALFAKAPSRGGARPAPDERALRRPQLTPERVLLVDDDLAAARAATRLLTHAGVDIMHVDSVARARHALEAEPFDTMVIEMTLPDGSGIDLLTELRDRQLETRVVLQTGAAGLEAATRAFRFPAHELLVKPVASQELLRAVHSALGARRVARMRSALRAVHTRANDFASDPAQTSQIVSSALATLRLEFQPIVRARDRSTYGFEALLRSDEPQLASPVRLLAATEAARCIPVLSRAVQRAVADTLHIHPHRYEAIFIKVHPTEVCGDLAVGEESPLLPFAHRIVLEIPERAWWGDCPGVDATLSRLRAAGFRFALDDLGADDTGPSRLLRLAPHVVRLDVALVRDLHRAPLQQHAIASVIDFARRSGIEVVAKGVETVEEQAALEALGCDLMQGPLYGRPGAAFPQANFPRRARAGASA